MKLTIDYSLEQLDQRIAHANELPLEKYSSHQLEVVANYILQKAPKEEKRMYEIVTQFEYDQYNKDKLHRADVDIYNDEVIQIIKRDCNEYINMDWKVTAEDLNEDSLMGEILRSYNDYIVKLQKLAQDKPIHFKKYRRIIGEIKNDMLIVKKIFKGYTEKRVMPKWLGETLDYELLDYTDVTHVKAILKTLDLDGNITPNNTLTLIAEDMRATLRALYNDKKISSIDIAIVQGLNRGYTLQELEDVANIQCSGINKRFNKVCFKIAQYHSNKNIKKVKKISKLLDKNAA